MKRNFYENCYIAFYWTLEYIFKCSKQPIAPHPFSLCDLLSNMCPFTFSVGMSADPAAFYDYERFLKKRIAETGEESAQNGYGAGKDFLHFYMYEYGYDLSAVMADFSEENYTFAYEKAIAE